MKLIACLSMMLSVTIVADNLLKNGNFSQGMEHWGMTSVQKLEALGISHRVENNALKLTLPDKAQLGSAGLLLFRNVKLLDGHRYNLRYTLRCDKPGVTRHLYQLSAPPYAPVGLVENIDVKPGVNTISTFFEIDNHSNLASHLTFNLSKLKGTVELTDVVLEEILEFPVSALSRQWTVFCQVQQPANYDNIPATLVAQNAPNNPVKPQSVELNKDGRLDFRALNPSGFALKSQAIAYNRFESKEEGFIRLGFGADWWMEVFANGTKVLDTLSSGNRSQAFSPNDHQAIIPIKAGSNLIAIRVLAGSKGWMLAVGAPAPPLVFREDQNWKPTQLEGHTEIIPGTPLDLAAMVDVPAGKHGPVVTGKQGNLEFKGLPGIQQRFLGCNGIPGGLFQHKDDEIFRSQARKFAQMLRNQGYRLFRTHGVLDATLCLGSNKDMDINPKQLDRWDFLINELKQQGIYTHITLLSFGLYDAETPKEVLFEERDKHKMQLYLGGAWIGQHFKYAAETLLNHVNPYTKLKWKDDPAIAFVEFYNEQELGLERMNGVLNAFPNVKDELTRQFRAWLKQKYADKPPKALADELKGTTLDNAALPANNDRKSNLADEFALFRIFLAERSAQWCENIVRSTGYKGLTTNFNVSKKFCDAAARWTTVQAITQNTYYQHPAGGWGEPGCTVGQLSSIETEANYWRAMLTTRFAGRPFVVSEFNHCFWNPYQYEAGALFGAYAAFQGFDALQIHSNVTLFNSSKVYNVGSFSCANNPVVRANEFISAHLFQRGDVQRSKNRIDLLVPEETLQKSRLAQAAVAAEQGKLGFITGFAVAFPNRKRAQGTQIEAEPTMKTIPEGVAGIDAQDWFVNIVDNPQGQAALNDWILRLKANGVLAKTNLSNAEQKIYQSDTEQITMKARENLLRIVTPRSEVACLPPDKIENMGTMKILGTSVPACVALIAIDGKPLANSAKMVLVYSTQVANTSMKLSHDGAKKLTNGGPPVLLKCGKLDLEINRKLDNAALYDLGFDGARRQKLPIQAQGDKTIISIDTATLENGPTVFFELFFN
ncbi:MAG: hypothetical protein GX561_12940 [Lentisphaerae bacterium]|jgi:hypothetical protein|nr:hypothetical protein [Lentisphaerota bacterium]